MIRTRESGNSRRHAGGPRALVAAAVLLLGSGASPSQAAPRAQLDLNGRWEFQLDSGDQGERGKWYAPESGRRFESSIQVPGCWQAQGFGEPRGILRYAYSGQAWYRRSVTIPKGWADKVIVLRIGGIFRQSMFFVNGRRVGEHEGFCTPFELDISDAIKPGAANVVAVRVANPGSEVTTTPDKQVPTAPTGAINYLGNWGGISGNVVLEARERIYVEEVRITPDLQKQLARFQVKIRSADSAAQSMRLAIRVSGHGIKASKFTEGISVQPRGQTVAEAQITLSKARLWTPETPFLYTAKVVLSSAGREWDQFEDRFGMREITTRGNVLLLNGKPLYLRGYGDDHVWVRSGVPPAGREVFRKQFQLTRSYGFNAVRFHSSVPVRECFEAADEVGMLILAELPAAYSQYFMPFTNFLRAEMTRVLQVHHNRPSFLSLALGDELGPDRCKTAEERRAYLDTIADFYAYAKRLDPDRLILSNDGNLLRPSDMDSLASWASPPNVSPGIPLIRHEFGGYWGSLPDVSLLDQFDGVIVPTWLEPKRQWVETNGLAAVYPRYLLNSQRLLRLGRKHQIESVRRDLNVTGYEYWLITDYPGGAGEGDSWEEGWFNCFWQPKGGVSPREGQELNSPVLLMLEPGASQRTMWNDQVKELQVWISNYGPTDLQDASLRWTLKSGRKVVARAVVSGLNAACGKVGPAARLELPAPGGDNPQKLQLTLELSSPGRRYANHWDFWSFPRQHCSPAGLRPIVSDLAALQQRYAFIRPVAALGPEDLLVTTNLAPETLGFLHQGGRVLLLAGPKTTTRKPNSKFFPAAGGAQGTLVRNHAALGDFPHDGFCDQQFYHLLEGAYACPLDAWPKDLEPLVGGIKTAAAWLSQTKNLSRIGYVFEMKVGQGRLLVSTLRLQENLTEDHPEAWCLLDCLLRYCAGSDFKPTSEVSDNRLSEFKAP